MSDPLFDLVIQDGWLSIYIRNIFEIDINWLGIILAVGVAVALRYTKKRKRK